MAKFKVRQLRKFTATLRILPGRKSKRIGFVIPGLRR